MRAILLCGGHGTRLRPLTKYCNKHLLPIYHFVDGKPVGTPIVEFAIQNLKQAGIKEVGVILGDFRCEDILTYLGDGSQYNMEFTYIWQGEPLGIAHAVACAEHYLRHEEGFLVYLGDNFFDKGISDFVKLCENLSSRSFVNLLFAHTKDARRFGSPVFSYLGKLKEIIEKPQVPQSDLAVSGCYYYRTNPFFAYFKKLQKSARGEYELSDLITNILHDFNEFVFAQTYDGFWSDAGTFESILEIENYLRKNNA